jgi:hypothetical protein
MSDAEINEVVSTCCPWDVGIDYPPGKACTHTTCKHCWNRDIPELTKKENNMTDTKKTKAQLIEELNNTRNTVTDLEKQLKNLEKYSVYEDAATEIKALHTAFVDAGFTNDQAFTMLMTMMQINLVNNAVPTVYQKALANALKRK